MTKKMLTSSELLIGAHTSTAKGVYNALYHGRAIGATTVQLFTANQRQWQGRPISLEAATKFKETLCETGLKSIMSHGSYLINLGSPDPLMLEKSRQAFLEEIKRCLSLGISFLNFHPGSALSSSKESTLDCICHSILACRSLLEGSHLRLVLETCAGQGSSVGSTFEEIAYIVHRIKDQMPIGVCIDTCHIFAAGYDIRTEGDWKKVLIQFDEIVGLDHLVAFHLNDSVGDLASRKDRHASLGSGKIGWDAFRFLMEEPTLRLVPKYLETPDHELWEQEIRQLREFADGPTKN